MVQAGRSLCAHDPAIFGDFPLFARHFCLFNLYGEKHWRNTPPKGVEWRAISFESRLESWYGKKKSFAIHFSDALNFSSRCYLFSFPWTFQQLWQPIKQRNNEIAERDLDVEYSHTLLYRQHSSRTKKQPLSRFYSSFYSFFKEILSKVDGFLPCAVPGSTYISLTM